MEQVMKTVLSRHSSRRFNSETDSEAHIKRLLQAASHAPSGKNLQPWAFAVINDRKTIIEISKAMRFSRFIEMAPCIIAVYKVHSRCYDVDKDSMAIGAAIENILLCAHEQGYGTCWIGENISQVEKILANKYDTIDSTLMSIVAVGKEGHSGDGQEKRIAKRKSIFLMRCIEHDK